MARSRRLLDELCLQFATEDRKTLYARIMCGEVRVAGEKITDPSYRVPSGAPLSLSDTNPVSRAGAKLAAALDAWQLPVAGRTWLDAGASTGGFTELLLERGAAAVHAVDVGYNQLAWRLRADPRVVVHERTNVRFLDALAPPPDAAVADLSFRSLRGILRHILSLTGEGWGVALLKPQFELAAERRWGQGGDGLGDGGIVDPTAWETIVGRLVADVATAERIVVRGVMASPVPGTAGNRELLLYAALPEGLNPVPSQAPRPV